MYIKSQELSFKKALPTGMKPDFAQTIKEVKTALGINEGLSLLKLDTASFPANIGQDTGVGKLNSQKAIDLIKFLTFYTGTKAVKIFPFGQQTKSWGHYYCPYNKTAMTIGEENINLFNLLNKEKYGDILKEEDIKSLRVRSSGSINYENELGVTEYYPILQPLRKAFDNFKNHLSTPELEQKFEDFKQKKYVKEYYPRLALYPYLKDKEPDLFKNFRTSKEKQEKFIQYQEKYKDEIEFFKFRQFIADKEHFEAKEKLNSEGIKLFGDCLIGFSNQEFWAHPDAFVEGGGVGWSLPALNDKKLLCKKSLANKVFNDKISFYLEHFDGIRFDVGWWYAYTRVETKDGVKERDMKHKVFDFIEKRAKEIKGKDFDTRNLIYEMDGFSHLYHWNTMKPLENVKNIVSVLTTEYENDYGNHGAGWGHPEFLLKNGFSQDEFIIGTNNHDGENLRILAESKSKENRQKRADSISVLAKVLNIPAKVLEDSKEFVKAKFAQLYTTKNQFLFYVDVLGAKNIIDNHTVNPKNYRMRLNDNFESQYHTSLQNGNGFNIMESLKLVLKSRRLDENYPDLYQKVCYYADYLREPGAKTEAEANIAVQ